MKSKIYGNSAEPQTAYLDLDQRIVWVQPEWCADYKTGSTKITFNSRRKAIQFFDSLELF